MKLLKFFERARLQPRRKGRSTRALAPEVIRILSPQRSPSVAKAGPEGAFSGTAEKPALSEVEGCPFKAGDLHE